MAGLTVQQRSVIGALFAAAPDAAVRRLEMALSEEVDQGGPLAEVHALVARETAERKVRSTVLAPMLGLCRPSDLGDRRFAPVVIGKLWAALRASAPDLVDTARAACLDLELATWSPDSAYNELCAYAASALRAGDPAFTEAARILDAEADGLELFLEYLDLAPHVRRAQARLPDWLGRMTEESAAAARLAYRDAEQLSDTAGPRFIEMLLTLLPEPWLILRILSVVVAGANDRYLASSELAEFGECILRYIESRLAAFRAFDPDQGRAAGVAAADGLHKVAQAIAEFESALELSREGPWGVRVARAKQHLAEAAEIRLSQIEKAIDQALPLQLVRFGRGTRGVPKLVTDPDPRLLRRAEGLIGFYEEVRNCAASSGFGAVRAKIGAAMAARLEQYVEDLLEDLRSEDPGDIDRLQAYLDASASLIGLLRGEKAAQIVRRRSAAA
jgi:hypothetical protein